MVLPGFYDPPPGLSLVCSTTKARCSFVENPQELIFHFKKCFHGKTTPGKSAENGSSVIVLTVPEPRHRNVPRVQLAFQPQRRQIRVPCRNLPGSIKESDKVLRGQAPGGRAERRHSLPERSPSARRKHQAFCERRGLPCRTEPGLLELCGPSDSTPREIPARHTDRRRVRETTQSNAGQPLPGIQQRGKQEFPRV